MKQRIGVLSLMARSAIGKLMLTVVAMAALQSGLFLLRMGQLEGMDPQSFETILDWFPIRAVFDLGLAGALLAAGAMGTGLKSGKNGYFLRRLSVPEWELTVLHGCFTTLLLVVFLAAQLAICFLLFAIYQRSGAVYNGMSFYLACYRSSVLHSLLPLEDASRYLRNAVLLACLGASVACSCCRERHSAKDFQLAVLLVGTMMLFFLPMGEFSLDLLVMVGALVLAGVSVDRTVEVLRHGSEAE